ncbi:MAG: transcriptional regulator [Candidatus Binatia bacterium]|jgi:transcriptional regulator
MYIPARFRIDDPDKLHAFIRENSFATVISRDGGGAPFASHLPLLLRDGEDGGSVLLGHMARANPQWKQFSASEEILAVFHGPHGYISPSWYASEPVVPTWNYTAVHAYGIPRIVESGDRLAEIVDETVTEYESGFEQPWKADLPEEFRQNMMKAIVGFEIPIARLEGKFKLGQNRYEVDVLGACAGLEAGGSDADAALAKLMKKVNGLD